jgi:hypothetical protein
MYGLRALVFAGYFITAGYILHKRQIPQRAAAAVSRYLEDSSRRSARVMLEEWDNRMRLTDITDRM